MREHETLVICCAKCERTFESEGQAGACPHCKVRWEYKPLPVGWRGKIGNGGEKKETNG